MRLVVLTLLSYCCSCTLTCERFFSFFFVFFKLERTASEPFQTSSVDLGRTKSHRFLSDLIAWMHCTFAVYTCYSLKLPVTIKDKRTLQFRILASNRKSTCTNTLASHSIIDETFTRLLLNRCCSNKLFKVLLVFLKSGDTIAKAAIYFTIL